MENVKYVSDADGNAIEVIVPIDVWRDLTAARATGHSAVGETVENDSSARQAPIRRKTYIGVHEASGFPVFVPPPGSPTITTEDVKKFEDDW